MQTSLHLLAQRRFLPLFVTQLLNAFNDNLFKNAMVLFVVYRLLGSEAAEMKFSAIASALFILPFFVLSALAGQLADTRDKARLIRIIKACEIGIMTVGAAGLLLAWQGIAIGWLATPLMLAALFAMGVHSTFFGPIKYAILPQHLQRDEVLGGTGLVEAGTYLAILGGTILAGLIPVEASAAGVVLIALVGYAAGRQVPPAPPEQAERGIDWHLLRSSAALVRATTRIRRLGLAIASISFFWSIGAVLIIQFPPLAKNVLDADKAVASLLLAVFSVGIAIGSVAINRLLKGRVSARFAPVSVLGMGAAVIAFHLVCRHWQGTADGSLYGVGAFLTHPDVVPLLGSLLMIAVTGGMFVVPLYAFLTTTVPQNAAARTVAANNIVNSGAMVAGSLLALAGGTAGMDAVDQLLIAAAMCGVSAWLATRLVHSCDGAECISQLPQVEIDQAMKL